MHAVQPANTSSEFTFLLLNAWATTYTAPWNNEPNTYQSEDKALDTGADTGPGDAPQGPNEIDRILEG